MVMLRFQTKFVISTTMVIAIKLKFTYRINVDVISYFFFVYDLRSDCQET
jgi:hypothetical protein